jgi:hypothetical protein
MSLTEQVTKAQVKNILAALKAGKRISRAEQAMVAAYDSGQQPDFTLDQVAKHYGISRPGALKWKRAMEKEGLAFNSFETIDKWREIKVAGTDDPQDHSAAKLRKTLLEVERLELQVAQIRGDYVSKSEVREQGIAIGAALSAELGSMMTDMPGVLAGLDEIGVRERLQARLDLMLERTNDRLRETTH